MAVNPNIALAFRPTVGLESPGNMMAQAAQIRGLETQNQMRAMQMEQAQRDQQRQNALIALRQGMPGDLSPQDRARRYYESGFADEAAGALKLGATLDKDRATADKARVEAEAKRRESVTRALGTGLTIAMADPSDAGLNAAFGLLDAQGVDTTPFRQQFAQMTPEQRVAAIQQYVTTNPEGRGALEFVSPKWTERSTGATKFYEDTNPRSPSFGQRRSEAQMQATPDALVSAATSRENNAATNARIAADNAAARAVSIRGQNMTDARAREANAPARLANDPDHQLRLAEAKARGAAIGKNAEAARVELPTAIQQGRSMLRHIDAMVGAAPDPRTGRVPEGAPNRPHPGFGGWLGAVGLRVPGVALVPGTAAADFTARLNEVQGGAFMQAFETLKGGGQITEREGEKATQAITRMSTSQSEREFITAAREFQDIIRAGLARAEGRLREVGAGAAPATPPAAGGAAANDPLGLRR